MKRRTFIRNSILTASPVILSGFPVVASTLADDRMLGYLAQTIYGCGKILVIIQQNGGNDGLNTIVPLDKYENLYNARPNIILPQSSILPLTNTITTGMHPALTELRDLYNTGKVCIVQAVSYPNPNFSHFRATDIWFSASNSNQYLDTGWLGRTLNTNYPDYPASYPSAAMEDPLAIQIGSTLPFSLQGPTVNMGYNVSNPAQLLNVINAKTDPAPNNDYGRELTFLRLMKDQSNAYTGRISGAYNKQTTKSTLYPSSGNSLADQLKIVARLIGGGLSTPVYIVNHPNSHDTHVAQVISTDTTTGTQANNLSILSKAINAFQNDIELMGKADLVTGMTFSEFGRRIISNASTGTDHGTAAPVIFFGAGVNGSIIGSSPNIPLKATVNDQVPMQYDFRQLYSSVMQDWLCLSSADAESVLGSSFSKLPIFSGSNSILPINTITLTGQYYNGSAKLSWKVHENPKYDYFIVQFSTDGSSFTDLKQINNTSLNADEIYSYTHEIAASKMYYRIAGQTLQGKRTFSETVLLRSTDKQQLMRIYPNPVLNYRLHIELFEQPAEPVDVIIYDLLGAKVYYNRFTNASSTIVFNVPHSFSKQTHYILEVKYGSTVAHEQIVFQ